MTRIGYVDLSTLKDGEYRILYTRASQLRQQRADRYLRKEDSYRCVVADALLRYVLMQSVGTDQIELAQTPSGKPYLPGLEAFQFNLSHSGRWVAIAWDRSPVGIDVETVVMDPGKEELARRYFCCDEQAYLFAVQGQERAERFFEIWTKKESYLKFQGTGINRPLNSVSVLHALNVNFHTQLLEDAVLTLCSQSSKCESTQITLETLLLE